MKINAKTRKSHSWNEDRFIIGDNYFIVIDGATPLIKNSELNLACFMVKYIKNNINKYDGSIATRLENLSRDIYQSLNINSTDPAFLPSASIAYLEIKDDFYHIGIIGDCEVTLKKNNGEIIRCYDDSLPKLDNIALSKMKEIALSKNVNISVARKDIQDLLIKHRRMQNTSDGYRAYSVMPNYKLEELTFDIAKNDIEEIYLYSDGFADAFTHLGIYESHLKMFEKSLDIDKEINRIKEVSFNDKNCNKHLRFKLIDDITVIQIIN